MTTTETSYTSTLISSLRTTDSSFSLSKFNNIELAYFLSQNQSWLTDSDGIFEESGHTLTPTFSKVAAFLFILIIATSVCCNILLILIIVRVKSLHTIMNVFIVNLAISDLITSAGTMPFDVDFMLRGKFDHGIFACGVMHFTFLISLPSSVLNLVLLTTERFISVVYPFHRIRYLNKISVIIMLITTWAYTCGVALYPMLHQKDTVKVINGRCLLFYPLEYDIFQLVANFAIPIIFICFENIVLFNISNRHASRIRTLTIRSVVDQELTHRKTSTKSSSITSDKNDEPVAKRPLSAPRSRKSSIASFNMKVNLRAAKKLALLVGVFLFCWLTYIILVATNISCGICHPRELTWIGNIINYSSSAVNPVLYGLLNTKIRDEIKKWIRQFSGKFLKSKKDYNGNSRSSRTQKPRKKLYGISELLRSENTECNI